MRMIDSDVILEKVFKTNFKSGSRKSMLIKYLNELPTLDAEFVRHGVWVEKGMSPNMLSVWECSECNLKLDGKTWPYYPNCGARMDVEVT